MSEAAVQTDYIRTRDVAKRIGVTRRTLMSWIARGRFPDPDIIGDNGNWHYWHKNTIERWVKQHGGR